jgi:hypothetical protein
MHLQDRDSMTGRRLSEILAGKALRIVIALSAFLLVSFSEVRNTGSDPRASLLVSETILTHGTIKLDHYGAETLSRYGNVITEKQGHLYYYFPLGTPLFSLPFVALARAWGLDMPSSGPAVQIGIASLIAAMTILLLMAIADIFVPRQTSSVLATVFWCGTSLASTSGTAL